MYSAYPVWWSSYFVYREPEIMALLAAARQIGPDGGLRPLVMEPLFGLIAYTGLRTSEALGCWMPRWTCRLACGRSGRASSVNLIWYRRTRAPSSHWCATGRYVRGMCAAREADLYFCWLAY